MSKILNTGLVLLGLSRPLTLLLQSPGNPAAAVQQIIKESTFGLAEGSFDLDAGLLFYSPAGAAVGLGKLKSYLMRHFPVR